jgi:hypothetical protein
MSSAGKVCRDPYRDDVWRHSAVKANRLQHSIRQRCARQHLLGLFRWHRLPGEIDGGRASTAHLSREPRR